MRRPYGARIRTHEAARGALWQARRDRYRWTPVGTAKRERQRANKAQHEAEVARQATRSRTVRIGLLVAAAIVAVFVLVAVAGNFVGDDESAPIENTGATPAVVSVTD
jgi:peptidyl-prolyl cis-trans isomerase B (cyclophilin B)